MIKSPFPGMDPYLESLWPEVHARLIVYAANQLNTQLPDDLQANIPVPLRYRERDAVLLLQPLIEQCYQDGRYHRLDYRVQPYGTFNEELTQWIDERLQTEGRRATTD